MDSNINDIMAQAMESLKAMIDVDTVVGKPVAMGSDFVVPVSRVTFGFIAGGSEFSDKGQKERPSYPHAGGSGSIVSINPMGFLIVGSDTPKVVKLTEEEDKWSKAARNIFSAFFKKDKDKEKERQ